MVYLESDLKVELLSITQNAERLIEDAGRTSYLSFDKEGEGTEKTFIQMLLKRGHESVLEHASATFRISGISRSLTHQLVRHRLASYTQQSQRYVNEKDFKYIIPKSIKENSYAHFLFIQLMEKAKDTYIELKRLGINNEDSRFVLPNAVETQIVITANMREWRHIIELRGERGVQWEIREMVIEILKKLKEHVPTIFSDFIINEEFKIIRKEKNS